MHNDPALGATLVVLFYEYKAITSPRLLQAWQPGTWGLHNMEYSVFTSDWDEQYGFLQSGSIYIEASLKPSLCSTQDLGATGIILLSKKYFQILCFEQTRLTRCHQSLWPCAYNPASSIIMNRRWQQSWPGIISFYNPTMVVIINRQVLHLQAGWISVEYFRD